AGVLETHVHNQEHVAWHVGRGTLTAGGSPDARDGNFPSWDRDSLSELTRERSSGRRLDRFGWAGRQGAGHLATGRQRTHRHGMEEPTVHRGSFPASVNWPYSSTGSALYHTSDDKAVAEALGFLAARPFCVHALISPPSSTSDECAILIEEWRQN